MLSYDDYKIFQCAKSKYFQRFEKHLTFCQINRRHVVDVIIYFYSGRFYSRGENQIGCVETNRHVDVGRMEQIVCTWKNGQRDLLVLIGFIAIDVKRVF